MLLPLHPPRLLLLLACCLWLLLKQMLHARLLGQLAAVLLLLHALPRSQLSRHDLLLLLHGQHAGMAKPHLPALSRVLRLVLASGRLLSP
jgi:hypothetical protein